MSNKQLVAYLLYSTVTIWILGVLAAWNNQLNQVLSNNKKWLQQKLRGKEKTLIYNNRKISRALIGHFLNLWLKTGQEDDFFIYKS